MGGGTPEAGERAVPPRLSTLALTSSPSRHPTAPSVRLRTPGPPTHLPPDLPAGGGGRTFARFPPIPLEFPRPMGRYTGPKLKRSKRVRAPISDTTKHMKAELENGPGVHGARRRGKSTIYGDRLREKQKLAFFYSVGDRQFRRYMAEAERVKTNTAHKLNELLERRLDNVVRRAALARTIWQARQLVSHGHVQVNGHRVNRPSYLVEVGDAGTPFTTHRIARPRAVRAAVTQPGEETDVEIEGEDGTTTVVRIRRRPELPPPRRS